MYICPVCNKENKTVICGECGFDISRNYECFSTISLPVGAISAIQAQRTTWEKKKYPDCWICSACGGISFRIGKEDARAVCVRCGKGYPLKLKAAKKTKEIKEKAPESPKLLQLEPSPALHVFQKLPVIAIGEGHMVVLRRDGTVDAFGDNKFGQCSVRNWNNMVAIAASGFHTVGLRWNGQVSATGWNEFGQCNVSDWTSLIAIDSSPFLTVGLRADGTVLATGWDRAGECRAVSGWKNIAAITVSDKKVYGLKKDGTVVSNESDDDSAVSYWHDIVALAAAPEYVLGLKSDGSVFVSGKCHQIYKAFDWRNIVNISASSTLAAGLTRDGSVMLLTNQTNREIKKTDTRLFTAYDWRMITDIACSNTHIAGLRADGTVIASGDNSMEACNVFSWRDVAAIYTADHITIGLRTDGFVYMAGYRNSENGSWTDIRLPQGRRSPIQM